MSAYRLLLWPQLVDATVHLDPRALLVALAQLHALVVDAQLLRLRQAGVLLDDDLLGLLEVAQTLLACLVLLGVGGGLLGHLLLVGVHG